MIGIDYYSFFKIIMLMTINFYVNILSFVFQSLKCTCIDKFYAKNLYIGGSPKAHTKYDL